MGKNKKKEGSSAREEKQAKKVITIIGVAALILMFGLWIVASMMS